MGHRPRPHQAPYALSLTPLFLVFEEQFKYKETKRKEQQAYEVQVSKEGASEFDVVVKASNPKRKITTVVKD